MIALCVCTREAIRSMRERGVDDGHIIMMNSLSGHRVPNIRGVHFYAASKFAVSALTEGVRQELREARSHIRVTSISPGLVETEVAAHTNAAGSSMDSASPTSPRPSLTVTSGNLLTRGSASSATAASTSTSAPVPNGSTLSKYLNPRDVVDAIVYVLSAPAHVQVHDILLRPTNQLN